MSPQSVYFAGTHEEVAHHAAPVLNSELASKYPVAVESPSRVFELANPGDLAVVYSEHFDRFRSLVFDLKQRQIATVYLIDGILEWRNAWENLVDEPACPFAMRPILAHKAACIGPAQARTLACWGNAGKLEIVGVPRFSNLVKNWFQLRSIGNSEEFPFQETSELKILIATAKCPGFTPEQVSLTTQSLGNLKDWISSKRELHGHTVSVNWRLTGRLTHELGVENNQQQLPDDLSEQISWADVVVTTPSTLMLESMLLNTPTVLLNYHHVPVYFPAAWEIHGSEQIAPIFEDLLTKDTYLRRMHYQQFLLSDQLAVSNQADESGTARFNRLADTMLQSARQQIQAGKNELSFEENILGPLPFVDVWDQATVFDRFSDFRNSDCRELQAQLAHSRREIDLLHRELAQAKSELGEAHEIFEQIHKHPIAGPIVRVRQRILNWLAGRKQNRTANKTS